MNDRIDDLIALAALGELTDLEAAELDAAVQIDAEVRDQLADALTSAAALQATSRDDPPASLRASVLDAIAATPQATPTQAASAPVTYIERARRGRRFAPLFAAAAVLLLVIGGVVVVTDRNGGDDPIAAVVDADDAVAIPMTGDMGDLQMWYSPGEDAVVVVGDSVPVPPDDSTYQLWVVTDGEATPLGTFEPDRDGMLDPVRVDDVDPAGSVIGITVEPTGGSDVPTLPMLASSV